MTREPTRPESSCWHRVLALLPSRAVKTTDLTKGERLIIERRRDEHSQHQAAEAYEVSLYAYRQWEMDEEQSAPMAPIGRLQPFEVCFIQRRRKGMALRDLAMALGLSRWWVTQMEYGRAACDRLIEYWSSQKAAA